MGAYVIRRVIYAVITLLVISVVAYVIIQLPPGDYLTSYIMRLEMQGGEVTDAEVETLKREYGFDLPPHLRYFKWMANLLRGDLGRSFFYNRPVLELLAERLPLSLLVSLLALLFTYLVSIPVGIYSATHQYSLWDYTLSFVGFVGLATPNFILALLLMFFFFKTFGLSIGGLFSPEYLLEPWSWGKFVDLLKHLPVPVIVIGTAGTAGLIRVMRGLMLDEMAKQYVVTARAKGVGERRLLFKYPVRVSLNPIVSTIGWTLPAIVSGQTITAIVLSLPTVGPLLLEALVNEDIILAGSVVMILSFLTVLGTLLSDLLLVVLDPRIRFEGGSR